MTVNREALLARLHRERTLGRLLLVASAGSGLAARSVVAGGADVVAVYNSGRFRAAGLPSLAAMMPFAAANAVVEDLLREIVPAVPESPVVAGVCASDPFRPLESFLDELASHGVCGIQNFPSVGLIDGAFRRQLEESGLGFAADVALVHAARRAGLFTAPFVFDEETAQAIGAAGPDAIVVHAGPTAGGVAGVRTAPSVEDCARLIERLHDVVSREADEFLVLFHGASVSDPESLRELVRLAPMLDGYVAASAVERLPVERAVTEATNALKQVSRF